MSQQINLLNPALRRPFDWLSATPVAIAVSVLVGLLGAATSFVKVQTEVRQKTADALEVKFTAAQDKLTVMAKAVAESKANPQLAIDLANAQTLIKSRSEILQILEAGGLGQAGGFTDYLSGLARQVPAGLWLSSVVMGAGGSGMEIRGRMVNPSALPEYIRRLNSEKAFKGHSFSALTISRPEAGREKPAAGAKGSAAQTGYVEFVLRPSGQNWSGPETISGVQKSAAPPVEEKKS